MPEISSQMSSKPATKSVKAKEVEDATESLESRTSSSSSTATTTTTSSTGSKHSSVKEKKLVTLTKDEEEKNVEVMAPMKKKQEKQQGADESKSSKKVVPAAGSGTQKKEKVEKGSGKRALDDLFAQVKEQKEIRKQAIATAEADAKKKSSTQKRPLHDDGTAIKSDVMLRAMYV